MAMKGRCAGRQGAQCTGSVGPNTATIGTSDVAATCIGPLSPPTNKDARSHSARSSPSDQPAAGTTLAPGFLRFAPATTRSTLADSADDPMTATTRASESPADEASAAAT